MKNDLVVLLTAVCVILLLIGVVGLVVSFVMIGFEKYILSVDTTGVNLVVAYFAGFMISGLCGLVLIKIVDGIIEYSRGNY